MDKLKHLEDFFKHMSVPLISLEGSYLLRGRTEKQTFSIIINPNISRSCEDQIESFLRRSGLKT